MEHGDRSRREERRRGLRTSVWEGVAAQAHGALTGLGLGGNAVTFGFALLLGANDVALGLCAAIPAAATFTQLLGAWMAPRVRNRRNTVVRLSTLGRVSWLAAAALALWGPRDSSSLSLFLLLWFASCVLMAFSGNLWVAWMADLVPARLRSRYFARRTSIGSGTAILVGLLAGWALDRHLGTRVPGLADADPERASFALLFALAAAAGAASWALLRTQPEMTRPAFAERRRDGLLRAILVAPFIDATRTPGLRGLIAFVALLGLGNGLSSPFWTPFQLESLRLSYAYVSGLLGLVGGLVAVVALQFWGRLATRVGHRNVVALAVLITFTHPLYYLVATPERTWPMVADAFSSGFAWSGYNLAIFNLVLALAAGPRFNALFAAYASVAGLSGAVGAYAGGHIVHALPAMIDIAGFSLERRQLMFLVTSANRLLCLALFLRWVPDARGGARSLLALVTPWRVLRRDR